MRLAVTDDEVDWFKYVHGLARLAGYEAEIVGPNEVKTYHPLVEIFGVKAAYVTLTDGHVAPADITNAMAAGARRGGARSIAAAAPPTSAACRRANGRSSPSAAPSSASMW